ncbi:hypothetical protein AMTRI_Chr06g175330 [Amborella trichopoda]
MPAILASPYTKSEEVVLFYLISLIQFDKICRKMKLTIVFLTLSMIASLGLASDPSPLQDFCVADNYSKVFVNGKVCKDPMLATANDFFYDGLNKPGNTSNPLGSMVTPVNVMQIPGLNTLGISLARIDFAPGGENPPPPPPRGPAILTGVAGPRYVGFVPSHPENRLLSKTLKMGDVFVFPEGLIHFQQNVGYGNTVAIAGLSSQNPGVITIATAVFGADPPISDVVLAKAFQIDKKLVDKLQASFWMDTN